MSLNGIKTGSPVASTAGKLLKKEESNKEVKKVSASALNNAKDNTQQKKGKKQLRQG